MPGRVGQARRAPAEMLDQERAARPAHRGGKATEQSHRRDGAARRPAVERAERGKDGVIKPGAHAGPGNGPAGEIEAEIVRGADQCQPGRDQNRATRQYDAPAAAGDGATDPRRHRACNQKAERKPAHDAVVGPSGVGGDRLRQHGEQIECRAPGRDLQCTEHGHHDAARHWSGARRRLRHGSFSSRGGAAGGALRFAADYRPLLTRAGLAMAGPRSFNARKQRTFQGK